MEKVTNLAIRKNGQLIAALEELLERAREGLIVGLVYGVQETVGGQILGMAGSYDEEPMAVLCAAARLEHLANRRMDKSFDPEVSSL